MADDVFARGMAGMMDDIDLEAGMGDDPGHGMFHDDSPLFAKLVEQNTLPEFERVARGVSTKDKEQLFIARKALTVFIGRRDWSGIHDENEIAALLRLSDRYGPRVVGLDVIETLLGNSSMVFNYTQPIMELIERGRKIMRADREKEAEITLSSPVAKIVEHENARFERFCRALVQWNNRLVPNYEPYTFEERGHTINPVEKMYQQFRGKKDLVLCALVHWRSIFNALGRVRNQVLELYRWISVIHIESVCVSNPVNAFRCLTAFSQVTDLFPEVVVDIFRECLVESVGHSHPPHILDAIFPCAVRDEYDAGLVIDDPVRDLAILSLLDDDGAGRYEDLINSNASLGIVARQEIFSQVPTKFIPNERRYVYNQETMPEWHRETIRILFFKTMVLFTRSEQKGVWALQKEGVIVTLYDLFQSTEPELWCVFVCWWSQYRPFHEAIKRKRNEEHEALVKMVMDGFTTFGNSLKTREVTIGILRKCNVSDALHYALDFLGFPETGPLCATYEDEIRVTSNKLQNMSQICKRFFPADPCLGIVTDALSRWSDLQLVEVSYLFRKVDVCPSSNSPPGPLPETLIGSLDWILYVMNSKLFGFIWDGTNTGEPLLPKVEVVRREWESLYLSIVEQSIAFPRLQVISGYLLEGGDLENLYCSTTSSPQVEKLEWSIRPVDRRTLEGITVSLKKFSHLQGVVQQLSVIEECLPLFEKWIKDHASLRVFEDHVDAIKNTLQSHPWANQILKDYSKFADSCEAIHPSLLRVHPSLFEKIFECLDLLDWLATQPDDTDFTRGIEMAMGRGEMECPPELWLEEDGQAGRVNEQILSMLQSVRSYLHRFIFRKTPVFSTTDDFISQFLAHLPLFDKNILVHMETCTDYRLALQELLGGGNENAAPDRLLRMIQPLSDARWVCNSSDHQASIQQAQLVIDDFLRLEYKTHGRKKEIVNRSLSVSEIEDFQSSVVLARTDQRGEDTREKIHNFVHSFGWMKQYSTHLLTLNSLGHFNYDTFAESIPLVTNSEVIREKALKAKQTLNDWETMVCSVRLKYPCLNHFGMKLVWEVAKFLRDQATRGFSPDARPNLVQKVLYLVNPSLSERVDVVEKVEKDLLSKWSSLTQDIQNNEGSEDEDNYGGGLRDAMPESESSEVTQKDLGLEELLACCGQALEEVISKLPLNRQEVVLPEGNFSLTLKRGDFRLIMARSYERVFQEIFSSFLQTYCLPERRTLLLCRETSTWEDVHMLLLRWLSSTKEDKLFSLGCCDLLSNDVQVKAVGFIQEHRDKASAPLLLICGPSKGSYIVSQFLSRRIPSYPLSRVLLQGLVEKHYQKKFQTFASDYAGSGKTYQIRKGSGGGEKYVHVPATSIKQFLTLLNSLLSGEPNEEMANDPAFFGDAPLLLHFDVYDTVGAELNSYLFELIFFGGFCDFMNGVIFSYPLSQTLVSIELPTGPLSKHLVVPQLCPVNLVVADASLFAQSKKDLLRGMGLHQFYGVRYDGTAIRKREQNVRHANAYDRLQYVCFALDLLRRNNGRFPYVFDCNVTEPEGLLESLRISASADLEVADTDISGDLCFDLLVRASQLQKGKVSLWCLWNFVNMVYWQIRDMHFQGSPLNELCMPMDESENGEKKQINKKESNESKKLVKGEVLAFILRTAREFAIRQTNEIDPLELVGLEVKGFSRHDFNGTWTKEIYEHDGQPVFSTKGYKNMTFLMYFRAKEQSWVIDDLIASEGPSFSHTEKSTTYEAVWKTCSSWQPDLNIKCAKTSSRKAFNSEAYEIKGFPTKEENGVYFRQPPYDDINGHPHYMKQSGTRRHLFYSERETMWQICPVCTDDEGAFGIAQSLTSRWSIMPDDTVEKSVKFVPKKHGGPSAKPREPEEVESFFFDDAEDLMMRKEEDFNEFLKLERLFEKTKRWADSNHECLLFSNTNHIISFLSMNPKLMKKEMHPTLMEFLKENQVNIGESLDQLSARHHEILGALTEVYRNADEAKNLGGGNYCLTGDNLLKMLAIFIRLRVGIPVILMGECGCGKTALLNYLCTWLGVDLLVLDVHGGTTPEDIIEIFATAEKNRLVAKKPQYIFLDEVNACSHMGLICEVITRRSLHGNPIHDQIHILAALNPYRRRPPQAETFGLVYKHKKGSVVPLVHDEMANLVYRVTPIPASLRDFVFDFGSLEQDQERLYVRSMVCSMLELPSLDGLEHKEAQIQKKKREHDLEIITELVVESQAFVRLKEGDPSCVSLRDVRRFLFFVNFFMGMGAYSSQVLVTSVVVSLALVYYYRLSREAHRKSYWGQVCGTNTLKRNGENSSFQWPAKQKDIHRTLANYFGAILKKTQDEFCQHLEIEEGIAKNSALTENLFVTIVCILNRVPVFLVGKPGTSKTLTLQIIASNLQGNQSPNKFWRKYPSVYVFPYQCSPMSDSQSIQHQFNMAVRYQEHANNTITILLLDEVGLAEHSPDMPLKCLHGMLVDPPIAIVGLSNWVLDPAKMNRAVLVQRPEPSHDDICQTGSSIMGLPPNARSSPLVTLLEQLSRAYFKVYTNQAGRDFIGMRDYYSLIKSLRADLPKNLSEAMTTTFSKDEVIFAICRNFSGRDDILRAVLLTMCSMLYRSTAAPESKISEMTLEKIEKEFHFQRPSLAMLIHSNLVSHKSRHLMLLTRNCAALSLLFSAGLVDRSSTKVIVGSEFAEDDTELYLVQQMNEVKLAMATGKVIVLMNADNMYEALYDVLNQRYLIKRDPKTNKVQRLLRLAIGSRSSLCHVEDGFRIIVVAEQDYAYRELDLPLLNRFEKQILTPSDVLGKASAGLTKELNEWVERIMEETTLSSCQAVFCGYHDGTIPSLVFHLKKAMGKKAKGPDVVREAKKCLKRIASPASISLSPSLSEVDGNYHSNLSSVVNELFSHVRKKPLASILMTFSPVTHLEDHIVESLEADVTLCRLDQVKSEASFKNLVSGHLTSTKESKHSKKLLLVQFDPIMCSSLQINHAKFMVTNAIETCRPKTADKFAVLFLVHMPPGMRSRTRTFVLDFEMGWSSFFLDDIRGLIIPSIKQELDLPSLLRTPLEGLFEYGVANFRDTVSSQLPGAVSRMKLPSPFEPHPLSFLKPADGTLVKEAEEKLKYSNRIHAVKALLEIESFAGFFYDGVFSLLKHHGGKEGTVKGLLLHTSLAIGEMSCGSLIQSIKRTISELTMQAIMYFLIYLEKNFTLGTLKFDTELWMLLAANGNVVDVASLPLVSRLGGKDVMRQLQSKYPSNTGKTGVFVSKFPFSYSIFNLLSGDSTRKAIESTIRGQKTMFERFEQETAYMEKAFSGFFGDRVSEIVLSRSKEAGCLDYFHDFVAMIAPPVEPLRFEEIEFIHRAVMQSFHPNALASPAAIHASYRQNESKIQVICSLLSTLPPTGRDQVLKGIHEASNHPEHNQRMLRALEAVFEGIAMTIWDGALELPFVTKKLGLAIRTGYKSYIPTLIATAEDDITDLIGHWERVKEALEKTQKVIPRSSVTPTMQWRSIRLLKIFLEGYEKDDVQWGMGEYAMKVIELLRLSDPCSVSFFNDFFAALATFYSPLRCCVDCNRVIAHANDQNATKEIRCPICNHEQRWDARRAGMGGGKSDPKGRAAGARNLQLPQTFWDNFLKTQVEREMSSRSEKKESGSKSSSQPTLAEASEAESSSFLGRIFGSFFGSRKEKKEDKKEKEHRFKRRRRPTITEKDKKKKQPDEGEPEPPAVRKNPPPSKEVYIPSEEEYKQSKALGNRYLEASLVRYVNEILLSVNSPVQEIRNVDKVLIRHLSTFVNVATPQLIPDLNAIPDHLQHFAQFEPAKSTRVALMHVLLRAEKQANAIEDGEKQGEPQVFFDITTTIGKRIFLGHCLSEFEEEVFAFGESAEALTRLIQFVSASDIDTVTTWLNEEPEGWGNSREHIQSLARIQVVLRWYGKRIGNDTFPSDELSRAPEYVEFCAFFNNFLSGNHECQYYVLKNIKEIGGFDSVLSWLFVCEKKGCSWVEFDQESLVVVMEDCPIGPLIPPENEKGVATVKDLISACLNDPDDRSSFDSLVKRSFLDKLFIPALYSEISQRSVRDRKSSEFLLAVIEFVDKMADNFKKSGQSVIAALLPIASQIILLLNYSSLESDLLNKSLIPCGGEESGLTNRGKILVQLQLRLLIGAIAHPQSWLTDLMLIPEKYLDRYLPASRFETPLDGVRWYECPNGHPYSVGECGRPMQKGKCPSCGAPIGGQHHQNVAGVKDARNPIMDFANHLGYSYIVNERIQRLSGSSAAFFRLVVDMCLFLSLHVPKGSPNKTGRLVREREPKKVLPYFIRTIGGHIQEILQRERLDTMLVGVMLNAAFCNFADSSPFWQQGGKFSSKAPVMEVEKLVSGFLTKVNRDIHSDIKHRVDSSWQATQREKVLQRALGPKSWNALLENDNNSEIDLMWKYSPPPTIDHFLRGATSSEAFDNRHPLLSAFLEEENRLQLVRCMVHVLEWHRLLFSVYQNNEIDHEEASNTTNEEVIERLPTEFQREWGRSVLHNYCKAFNDSFPLVLNLFQCQENPFLKDGEVDLGGGGPMSPLTPISYSLPSISEGQKEKDAPALCTVQLLIRLHRIHEEALGLGTQQEEERRNGPQAAARADDLPEVGLPEVSCETPSRILRQKLIMYNRGEDLLPLLSIYSSRNKEGELVYELKEIEDSLRFGVLGGKQSTRLHVKYYQFRGDVRTSDQLGALGLRIPQVAVSNQTMQMIFNEVDTHNRITRLLGNLEVIVNFVTRIGGQHVKELGIGKTSVREYALETLQMDKDEWEEASTPSINEHICLCHLSNLFMRLQEQMSGSPLDDIPDDYRFELDDSQKEEFRKVIEVDQEKFLGIVLPNLHNFLTNRLVGERWDAELPLKDLLSYVIADNDDADWYDDHFPEVLCLKHSISLFHFLSEMQ